MVANADCVDDYVNDIQNCIGMHTCDAEVSLCRRRRRRRRMAENWKKVGFAYGIFDAPKDGSKMMG